MSPFCSWRIAEDCRSQDCCASPLARLPTAHHAATVVLYGRTTLAAARAAHLMLYAGVRDVRLLDGGWCEWSRDAANPVVCGGGVGSGS